MASLVLRRTEFRRWRLTADGMPAGFPLIGYTPRLLPEQLGDPAFLATHGLRYAYVVGAMANGITSEAMVEAVDSQGCWAFSEPPA